MIGCRRVINGFAKGNVVDSERRARDIVFSSKHAVSLEDYPVADIDRDAAFIEIFEEARPYTMTGKETMFALYEAVRYVLARGISGDFVECGVWRGGSALVAALAMRQAGDMRRLHLYDTFEGMTTPTAIDVDETGHRASDYITQFGDDGRWCYAGENDVRAVFEQKGLTEWTNFVRGDVLETLKHTVPKAISVLRLDTDWYESTKAELEVLYPLITPGGVIIIDDYGFWEGSRAAVEEYFENRPRPLLVRVTHAVRMAIV
jgi:O-methyltransferase